VSSVNDKILDEITGHSVDLLRVDAGLRKEVLRELWKLEKSLIKELEAVSLDEITRTSTQRRRLGALLKQTKGTIRTAYENIDKAEDNNLAKLAGIAERQAVSSINTAIKASTLSTGISKEMLESIAKNALIEGAPSSEWWSRQAGDMEIKFKDTIRQGMLRGETTAQIVRNIRGTRANKYKDGFMHGKRRGAEALVRTSVQVIANEARLQTYKNNDDIVKGIEWVSTLDNRTSSICRTLDGKEWDNERKPVGHSIQFVGATAHWNCRSTQVPVLKSWEELGAKGKFKEIPKSTRASMDGQVSAKKNYEEWLKEKPTAFQKDVLGKGKWDLWQKGKLGFTDMVDQTGNEISLEVLRRKFGEKVVKQKVVKRVNLKHRGKYQYIADSATDEANEVMGSLDVPYIEKGTSGMFYPEDNKIVVTDNSATSLHEYGHYIDYKLGSGVGISRKRLKKAAISDSDRLGITPVDLEKSGYSTKSFDAVEAKNKNMQKQKDLLNAKESRLKFKVDQRNPVKVQSDIMDSITDGEFQTLLRMHGHGTAYYAREGMKETENFANLFNLWAEGGDMWVDTKSTFPSLTKEFELIMKEVRDGKLK
jgi:SPP1 gp7 family putative phage head morphogenesis protein